MNAYVQELKRQWGLTTIVQEQNEQLFITVVYLPFDFVTIKTIARNRVV